MPTANLEPPAKQSRPVDKTHQRSILIVIAMIGAITGPFMASSGWWFVLAVWILTIPGFIAVQRILKSAQAEQVATPTTGRFLLAFFKPFLLWSSAAIVALLVGSMAVGAISGGGSQVGDSTQVDQPAVAANTATHDSLFIQHPIRYPTNAESWAYSSLLPVGFLPETEYDYTEFWSEIRKKLGQGTSEGQWLKCSLGSSSEASPTQGCQQSMTLPNGFWRVVYYENANQTWLEEVRHYTGEVSKSTVTILKVAEGKRPDLNIE